MFWQPLHKMGTQSASTLRFVLYALSSRFPDITPAGVQTSPGGNHDHRDKIHNECPEFHFHLHTTNRCALCHYLTGIATGLLAELLVLRKPWVVSNCRKPRQSKRVGQNHYGLHVRFLRRWFGQFHVDGTHCGRTCGSTRIFGHCRFVHHGHLLFLSLIEFGLGLVEIKICHTQGNQHQHPSRTQ